ncbi:unnamed protein product [Cercospora beticola]|nr:unnamed protein product [Cercospora beticola]
MAALVAQETLKSIWARQDEQWPRDLYIVCEGDGTIKVHQIVVCNGSSHLAQKCDEMEDDYITVPESIDIVHSICEYLYGHDFSHVFIGSGSSIAIETVDFLNGARKYGLPTLEQQITESIIRQIESMRDIDLCCFGIMLTDYEEEEVLPPAVFKAAVQCLARKVKAIAEDEECWSVLKKNLDFLRAVLSTVGDKTSEG